MKGGRGVWRFLISLAEFTRRETAAARGRSTPLLQQPLHVYLYYTQGATGTTPAHNRVIRVRARGDRAVTGTEKLILRLNNLSSATNHNGGALHFGEDGKALCGCR